MRNRTKKTLTTTALGLAAVAAAAGTASAAPAAPATALGSATMWRSLLSAGLASAQDFTTSTQACIGESCSKPEMKNAPDQGRRQEDTCCINARASRIITRALI